MTANIEPVFPKIGVIAVARPAAANTNRDGSGTITDLVSGGTDGTMIWKIKAKAINDTNSTMVRLYIDDGSGYELFHEFHTEAITPGQGVKTWEEELVFDAPHVLPSGHKFGVSQHTYNSPAGKDLFNVFAIGGTYS